MGAATRSWTQILNDKGAVGTTTRAFLQRAATMLGHWTLEVAFHSQKGRLPMCLSVVTRNMATLSMADLHPTGGLEIWYGN